MLANIIIDTIVDIDGSKKCFENRRTSAQLHQWLPANTNKYLIAANTAKQDKVCWR